MKVKFFTLGCKVNQYETQSLKEKFFSLGHTVTDQKADLYVINTCTVTARADTKSKNAIIRAKKENPQAQIAVCGCLVQLNEDFIKDIGVDYIIPQDQKHLLPDIVFNLPSDHRELGQRKEKDFLKISHFYNHRAFIKVQDGCNNLCSFCKIPFLRGPSRSKTRRDAIEEIEKVCTRHSEVVLCGVNLSLYGKDLLPRSTLVDLIKDILAIPSLRRLRLSSLEPFFTDQELFSLLKNDKLCPHFHFPFQYGDDRVLREMNKKETVGLYYEKVSRLRKVKLDAAISCDVMVGFPTESDESFQNTVDFLNRIQPMRMHIFTFSPREKTRFSEAKIKNPVLIRQRYEHLKKMADTFSFDYKNKFLGKKLNMVAEKESNGFVSGYTENYIKVHLKKKVPLGQIIPVVIEKVGADKVLASIAK